MQPFRTRKQIRLSHYDYSRNGYYFITICSWNRQNLFGTIPVAADRPPTDKIDVKLNDFGRTVEEELKRSTIIRKEILLDQYVVMPNHVHCIVVIAGRDAGGRMTGGQIAGGRPAAPTRGTLSSFVNGFKSAVTVRINTLRNMPGEPVWQRSFYDHIVRNERSLNALREYIAVNPINWERDIENVLNV